VTADDARATDGRSGDERPEDTADEGGTYTLVLAREAPGEVTVGALGTVHLPAGAYAYVGSALGAGGFARVDRHRRVAAGDHDTRHWHVDYLTGDEGTRLVDVVTSAGVDAECRIAAGLQRRLQSDDEPTDASGGPDVVPVADFGASDCDCRAHLFAHASLEELASVVHDVHETVRA
jgi:endonuclease-3